MLSLFKNTIQNKMLNLVHFSLHSLQKFVWEILIFCYLFHISVPPRRNHSQTSESLFTELITCLYWTANIW